jgi:hypothetical protein
MDGLPEATMDGLPEATMDGLPEATMDGLPEATVDVFVRPARERSRWVSRASSAGRAGSG